MPPEDPTPRSSLARLLASAMRPLSRIFMRFGCSARDATDVTRWTFVDSFFGSRDLWRNGRASIQQASLKTGLQRVEVSRLRKLSAPEDVLLEYRQNLAARVLAGWVNDPVFHENGVPADLPVGAARGQSFSRLVRKYGLDANARAVLDDLKQARCVDVKDGIVTIIDQTYGVNLHDVDKLRITAYMLQALLDTAEHNLLHSDPAQLRLKRVWRQMFVPEERIDEAMAFSREVGVEAGRKIDRYLSMLADPEPRAGVRYVEIGVGIYAFKLDGFTSTDEITEEKKQEEGS